MKYKWVPVFSKDNLLFKEVFKTYPMALPKEDIFYTKFSYVRNEKNIKKERI